MSLRLEMLQVARLAPKLLGESAELVKSFLLQQQNEDGGFKDRAGTSDLYYTVFGLDGLMAFEGQRSTPNVQHSTFKAAPSADQTLSAFDRATRYLSAFGDGAGLDFVHVCCLARAWATVRDFQPASSKLLAVETRKAILSRIEGFRSTDGGYNAISGSNHGTSYGCFLALGAYEDLRAEIPDPLGLALCLKQLETEDGAWTNEPTPAVQAPANRQSRVGSTNATAAAITVLRHLNQPIRPEVGDWLLARCHPQGGFLAVPNAPIPDLLSTATALHALAGLQVSFDSLKERCLDFVDSLWTNDGAFYGHWHDDHLDCEYTYYALLALGHLSL